MSEANQTAGWKAYAEKFGKPDFTFFHRLPWQFNPSDWTAGRAFPFDTDERFGRYLGWLVARSERMNEQNYVDGLYYRDGKYVFDKVPIEAETREDFVRKVGEINACT